MIAIGLRLKFLFALIIRFLYLKMMLSTMFVGLLIGGARKLKNSQLPLSKRFKEIEESNEIDIRERKLMLQNLKLEADGDEVIE